MNDAREPGAAGVPHRRHPGLLTLSDPRRHRDEFSSSVMSWSLVVMTRLAAEKPVDEMIRLTNSLDRSTLLCSSAPDRTWPAPNCCGADTMATPLLLPAMYWLPPRSTNPWLLANVAT